MSEVDFFDASTITPIARGRGLAPQVRRPALTVLWHTDLRRVGERTVVDGAEVQVGRNAPAFQGPGRDRLRPLADTCMSRGPAVTITFSGDGVSFTPHATKAKIRVQGAPLIEPRQLDAALMEDGIVVTIGGRIALCLHLAQVPSRRGDDLGIVGNTDAIEAVRREVLRVARAEWPVLIRGATGTGKELVMAALVAHGPRSKGPLVKRDMGALPAATAAAELFGHERGAFTGAVEGRSGYFAQAEGGTLFLDEIANAPLDVLPMLLRAVETREIVPLGSTRRTRRVDVRLITATDADLEAAIAAGRFSQPLYQRLSLAEIRLPTLRERRPDIGLLLLHFLRSALSAAGAADCLKDRGVDPPWLGADDVAQIALHDWSAGNVRELASFVGKLVLASEGEHYAQLQEVAHLLTDRLPPKRSSSGPEPRTRGAAADISDAEFTAAFDANHRIPAATARALGRGRPYIYKLMGRNGIRTADAIPDEEIVRTLDECGGDRRRAAEKLRVSNYALASRLAEISTMPAKRRAAR